MRTTLLSMTLGLGLLIAGGASAQTAATVTATCKDGSAFTGATRSGACRGHKGVATWDTAAGGSTASATATSAATTTTGASAQSSGNVTATCKDGSAFAGATRSGACRGHKGVATWGTTAAATTASAPAATAAPNSAPVSSFSSNATGPVNTAAAPAAAPPTSRPAPSTTLASNSAGAIAPRPGAPGEVWVNTSSKVYHCPGTRYYGKTKQGEYMSEVAAKAAGDHPSAGKVCS